ncbi:cell wall protein DAN4-like [Sphaeramia orbicularis]|uniref:cell wall protein DAN4-like n=1 Tax=Sphaeramia orbicularis TaxID=375764 RepID=UPI00117FD6F9|nr:cell wall protein DAN4-like [Sphaeramia orbicularis]
MTTTTPSITAVTTTTPSITGLVTEFTSSSHPTTITQSSPSSAFSSSPASTTMTTTKPSITGIVTESTTSPHPTKVTHSSPSSAFSSSPAITTMTTTTPSITVTQSSPSSAFSSSPLFTTMTTTRPGTTEGVTESTSSPHSTTITHSSSSSTFSSSPASTTMTTTKPGTNTPESITVTIDISTTASITTPVEPTDHFSSTIPSTTPHCPEFIYGNECIYGVNDTSVNIDTGTLPSRKVNVTLKIDITFDIAFDNLNSPEAITFINALLSELEPLCFEADPSTFKKVKVVKLSSGSVIADTEVEYIYPNNQTQINFVNDHLDGVLTGILNDTTNLKKIASAVNATSAQLNNVTFQAPNITNITQLEPFINCSNFVDYTPELSNGQWECVGPCKTHPNYCNRHGDCYNNIYKGPICKCYNTTLGRYYGSRCEHYEAKPTTPPLNNNNNNNNNRSSINNT